MLFKEFTFLEADIADRDAMSLFFASHSIRSVVHLAAQAGLFAKHMRIVGSTSQGF